LAVDTGHGLLDNGVGHGAAGPQIPWVVPFAGSTHRLGKDVHLNRRWLPSACGIPVTPTKEPCLMSAMDALTMATMSALLASATFSSAPSRGFHDNGVAVDALDGATDRTVSCAQADAVRARAKAVTPKHVAPSPDRFR
jgi:hypothetical protein